MRRRIRKITIRTEPIKIEKRDRVINRGTAEPRLRTAPPPPPARKNASDIPRYPGIIPLNSGNSNFDNPNLAETTDITINTPTLIQKIKFAVDNSLPLSVTRCGDGEMHLLKTEDDFIGDRWKKVHHDSMCLILNRNKIKRCSIHNSHLPPDRATGCKCYLNDEHAVEWLKMMKSIVKSCIVNSDYIGLNVSHKNKVLYGMSPKVLQKNGINSNSLNVIDSLFPRDYSFSSYEGFKDIFKNHPIHIITNNVYSFKKNNIRKYIGNDLTYTDISSDRSYKLRDVIKKDIESTNSKIILFGGGGAIKDLIPWAAKEHGKIAIDVGSVLDPWSGIKSRKVYERADHNYLRWG